MNQIVTTELFEATLMKILQVLFGEKKGVEVIYMALECNYKL